MLHMLQSQERFQQLVSIRLESSPVKVPSLLSLQSDSKLLRLYCNNVGTDDTSNLSKKEKLKRAVKDYGATVIIFHVTISLMSLGCCYLVVASGLDVGAVISSAGLGGSSEIANEAGLFVIAYAIHKVFAPVRISITLAATPFIVRYLRKINVLKTPRSKGV
ncbi:protein FAM210B, mitochondrial-like isoform X2 [Lycorma delicatula]|uniref:protein FAM210B, mitochondrial-like isoform X2 n=1 Tax=Lycorma delicatula TaxID=130591 RepID=UPI003F513D75